MDDGRQRQRIAEEAGDGRAEDDLALSADVEQTAAEGQSDAETGEDERCARDHRLGQGADGTFGRAGLPVEDRAAEQRRIGVSDGLEESGEELAGGGEEVLGGRNDLGIRHGDEDTAEEECEHDRQQRDEPRTRHDLLQQRLFLAVLGLGLRRRCRRGSRR